MTGRRQLSRAFEALSIRDYRILWIGTIFMSAGFQMQILARGFLAYDLTGSNSALGGVMLGFGVPSLLLGLWGGVIVDRVRKRPLLIGAQLVTAVTSTFIAVAITIDIIAYWMLVVAAAVQATSFSVVGPGRMAFTTSLVPRGQLPNAIALQQFSANSTRVIGPPIAGALIGIYFIGVAGVYYLTTVGFILSALSMTLLPPGDPRPRTDSRSVTEDLVEGLAYIRKNREIALLTSTMFVVIGLGFAYQTFLPSIAKEVFDKGSGGLGVLSGATAVGAVVASLGVAAFAGHRHAWYLQIGLGLGFGATLMLLGAAPVFIAALVVAVGVGAAQSGFQTLNNALIMTVTEDRFQGRVMSLVMMAFSIFAFTSYPLGILADHIGVRAMLLVQGGLLMALVVVVNGVGMLRGIRVRPRPAEDEQVPAGSPAGGGG